MTLREQPTAAALASCGDAVAEATGRVRDQALEVARGWSGDGSPSSWRLTAALFEALADDEHLATLAAAIPPDRLPALLFVASVQYVVAKHPDDPLAAYYPVAGSRAAPSTTGWPAGSAPSAPTTATSWRRRGAATATR